MVREVELQAWLQSNFENVSVGTVAAYVSVTHCALKEEVNELGVNESIASVRSDNEGIVAILYTSVAY